MTGVPEDYNKHKRSERKINEIECVMCSKGYLMKLRQVSESYEGYEQCERSC